MREVWIEAALNGPWSRVRQPCIPDTVAAIIEQGVACAKAGACIIHAHAYDGGGPQTFAWEVYARIIEGIRSVVDVPVYPSIPMSDGTGSERRFAHIDALGQRGLLEFAVVDPGSVNFTVNATNLLEPPAPTYLNVEADIRHGLEVARQHGVRPAYAIYEPGFARAGAVLAKLAGVKTPVYRFMFSDAFAFGFPPRDWAVDAHIALLSEVAPGAPWMAAGLGVDIRGLIPHVVAGGGHVRVGLEDAPFGTELGNVALVEDAARRLRAAGGEPASAAAMRAALSSALSGIEKTEPTH